MLPPLPRCSSWVYSSLISPNRVSLPRKGSPGRPAHRPFRGLLGVHSRCSLHTRAVTVIRDPLSGGFRHFVTSMPAPVASGGSESPGGACTHWKAPPCHSSTSYFILRNVNILRHNIQILANMARHHRSLAGRGTLWL